MGVWYCTREDVKRALDAAETARSDWQIDRAIEGATDSIDGLTHRTFRPVLATKYFDWPDPQRSPSWVLWLNGSELVELVSATSGGVAMDIADLLLEPNQYGPPYDRVEVNIGSASAWSAGDTHQRALGLTGYWMGCELAEEVVGTLAGNLDADVTATAQITWTSAKVGVGDVLRIGSERMVVAERTMVDTTQDLQADLAATQNAVTVSVSSGTAFAPGQVVLVESERMLVVDVAGNNVTVKRAWDGSVLASHPTGASIYSLTGVDIDRAQLGTTLAAHLSGAVIYRHLVPGLVKQLAVAESINTVLQEKGGYSRVQRSDAAQQEGFGDGLPDLRKRVYRKFGRKNRTAAI